MYTAGLIGSMALPSYSQVDYLKGLFKTKKGEVKEVTPTEGFYVQSYNSTPQIDVKGWWLRVDGLVNNPLTFSYEGILKMEPLSEYITLGCIGNNVGGNSIGNALWTGIPLKVILDMAGIKDNVRKVVFYAEDGYSDSIPLDVAMRPFNLLAYRMNNETLPPEHGYPLRLLVPGIYGMKNVKWIYRISLVDYDFKGYWEKEGWSDEAVFKTISRIDTPANGETITEGYPVKGIAFAGLRGIKRVELSLDGGKGWADAIIKPPLSPYSWVIWEHRLGSLKKGRLDIVVRATDGEGRVQGEERKRAYPDGAEGWHSVRVRVKG